MIAKQHPIERILKMCPSTELKIIPITARTSLPYIPDEYMLYGQPVSNGRLALAVLRDVCDEVAKRKKSGI